MFLQLVAKCRDAAAEPEMNFDPDVLYQMPKN